MCKVTYQQWLAVIATIGLGSASVGWSYGACHQVCENINCNTLTNPINGYLCLWTSKDICDPAGDVWIRGLGAGTCTKEIVEPVDRYYCNDCDPDCPQDPSDAPGSCSDCDYQGTLNSYLVCEFAA